MYKEIDLCSISSELHPSDIGFCTSSYLLVSPVSQGSAAYR